VKLKDADKNLVTLMNAKNKGTSEYDCHFILRMPLKFDQNLKCLIIADNFSLSHDATT